MQRTFFSTFGEKRNHWKTILILFFFITFSRFGNFSLPEPEVNGSYYLLANVSFIHVVVVIVDRFVHDVNELFSIRVVVVGEVFFSFLK